MRVGSLFSGIGGFDVGLTRAGFTVKWQSEIEPYCCKVLKKHWPEVPNLGDIYKIKDPPPVDLICGGFPCQPFSVAGKRKGKADDRYLWPEMLRVIKEVRPPWVIAENVPGIIQMELRQVLFDLEDSGYDFPRDAEGRPIVFIVPACAVNAPHRRDRVWILGYSKGAKQESSGRAWSRGTRLADSDRHAPDTEGLGRGNGTAENERTSKGEVNASGDKVGCSPADSKGRETQSAEQGGLYTELGGEIGWQIPWPEVATRLCRVDDGLPAWVHRHRVARLKALGNAIVPQIAEEIGRMILEVEKAWI